MCKQWLSVSVNPNQCLANIGQKAIPPRSTSGLQRLPYEIMAYIASYLDIDEIFDLSLCCYHFQYLMREESFCKAIVTAKALYTIEAQEAQQTGQFSRALRRVAKRRRALSQASPYAVGIVGLADSYEYIHGVLCYIVESRPQRWLRILDLHRSATCEFVVDIPVLIREAVPRSARSRKYKFRVLYHANGITSCLFSFALPNTENWLLIFNAEKKRLVAKMQLESAAKIFVRNNKEYLYFGTHSEEGADGYRKWVLTGFRIYDCHWLPQKLHLTNLVGYDVGSTVCFEIIDNHFYGLSNQTDFEIRETDWTSYYYCFRFPLGDPDYKTQTMSKDDSWRRQHVEGPIDDRWGFLKLEKDEASGKVNIIESRKEWLSGRSGSRRTYYITEVFFRSDDEVADDAEQLPVIPRTMGSILKSMDKSHNKLSRFHLPTNIHLGDDSSTMPMFTRSQTYLRSYQRSCSAYLDLVDDVSNGSPNSRCLRLRAGHRKLKPISWSETETDDGETNMDSQYTQLYQPNKIYFWPPKRNPANQTKFLNKIYRILNPPDCIDSVTATGDERSLVYAIGEDQNGLKVLVYISFDPAARLAGMQREQYILGEQDVVEIHGEETYSIAPSPEGGVGRMGKGVITNEFSRRPLPSYISNTPSVAVVPPEERDDSTWAWVENAMYRDLSGNYFTFAL
ncbi:hypothetical protein GGS23DRAFT_335854 [Durotheca rogersii]|uniref:uncharacterized protein n=1 Tax=Durotheca rogersii TaxID=419775 RepID=UPI002220D596|nr:uncharacterized protein GGS23DRAFT_335854 [Durotheca rogersii]KAI5858188.1 hypothetical protein GGS23DRAFT_335854 [Durotheca rogersii]